MKYNQQFAEYEALAKKIILKRRWMSVLTGVIVVFVIGLCAVNEVNFVVALLLALLLFFCGVFAVAFILTPITLSLDMECDPQKHLYLNTTVNKQLNQLPTYAVDLFYMGDFSGALEFAKQMLESNKKNFLLWGFLTRRGVNFS